MLLCNVCMLFFFPNIYLMFHKNCFSYMREDRKRRDKKEWMLMDDGC